MSFNFVTDPDDLLRKIPPNITRDLESVMRRIEGLLPSIYMGLEKALEKAPPGSPERTEYRRELRVVEKILKFLDNPGNSYLIGFPFQPVLLKAYITGYMAVYVMPTAILTFKIEVLGPTECTIAIFPVTIVYLDEVLRSRLVHELACCVIKDPYERDTYKFEEMLTKLVPDLFLARQLMPEHMQEPMMGATIEYLKQSRVPVTTPEITNAVGERIIRDTKYARQILRKSVIVQLKPSASWKKKS